MNSDWKTRLIQAYRLTTTPYRKWTQWKLARNGKYPVMVLFYHRVADDHPSGWSITRKQFQRHIDWLQDEFELVSLEECQRRIRSGENSRPTVSITFDDGYAENAEFALPMLIERRIPVTYFVTTDHILHQRPFPHDVELGQPHPAHSLESLRALDLAGIEIGGHTRTHANLGAVNDPKQLADEVITASVELGELIGKPLRYFAFPYGQVEHLNSDAFAMLRTAGFAGVCSAYGGWNSIGSDAFHLQRIHGDPNLERLKNWLTLDPRLGRVAGYDDSQGAADPNLVETARRQGLTNASRWDASVRTTDQPKAASLLPSLDPTIVSPSSRTCP